MLKATTALTVSLSLLQPGPLAAQGMMALSPQQGPSAGATNAPLERLWQVQTTCTEDPTLPECLTEEGVAPAEGAPAVVPKAETPAEPEAAPEATAEPEPAAEPVPESVEEPVAEPEPEVVAEPEAAETAPAAEAVPTVEADPAPDQAVEPAVPEAEPDAAVIEAPATDETVTEAPAEQAQPETTEPAAPVVEAPADETAAPAETPTEPAAEVAEPADEPAAEAAVEPLAEPAEEPAVEPAPVPEAEAAPEEPATAPEEPAAEVMPELSPEDSAVVETLLEDPEVAAAVDTLAETVESPLTDTSEGTDPTVPVSSGLEAVLAAEGSGPAPTASTTQELSAAKTRTSTQDFASKLVTKTQPVAEDDDDGLSDLEKAGLFALGAVAVGMLIANSRVVANSGDRVVVDRGDGNLAIWKDDNANLRAPGVVETTDRFKDGSTLTTLNRPDGTQIITIRDATGRVLRRDRVNRDGSRVSLIDDTRPYRPVVVSDLPPPRLAELRLADTTDVALLRALLSEAEQPDIGRTFSLAQVRDIQELRALAPELSGAAITFATGSSAIRPEEAGKLARLGQLMAEMIDDNPRELFLIEGHTDAVGSAAYNLALSDRRAESVALALTEIFGVPAENMVIQGYGERFLKVPVSGDEPRNRRVAVRRITWLIDG